MRKVANTTLSKPHLTLHARLRLLASLVLLAGVASSLLIYRNSHDIPPGYTPAIARNIFSSAEVHGGVAHALLADLMGWFCGLWLGKNLAYTIAYLTVILSAGLFFVAGVYPLPPTAVDDHTGRIE